MEVITTLRGVRVKIVGDLKEICTKVSDRFGFTVTPEDVVSQGVWSVIYRHDYAAKRAAGNGGGEAKEVEEI